MSVTALSCNRNPGIMGLNQDKYIGHRKQRVSVIAVMRKNQ